MKLKAVLIPSAVLVPSDLQKQMGAIPHCLYPLEDDTMLERLCDIYSRNACRVYLVIGQGKEKVRQYLAMKKLNVRLVELEKVLDLGHTVMCGLEAILSDDPKVEQVYINFADTLLSNDPSEWAGDVIYYKKLRYSSEWSYFHFAAGKITSVKDKCPENDMNTGVGNVFVGVFEIEKPIQFLEILHDYESASGGATDSFYTALARYSNVRPFSFLLAGDWFDIGHSANYLRARTGVAARSFNTIEIDDRRGILTKRSENKDKFMDEIRWYLKVPNRLQYLLPRVYDYSLAPEGPFISMEFYGYNSLHELLLYGNPSMQKWRTIFEQLHLAVEDMARFQVQGAGEDILFSTKEMYLSKTIARLKQLKSNPEFAAFFSKSFQINGIWMLSIDRLIEEMPGILEKGVLNEPQPNFHVIHGDLCFSNILVENNHGFLRLVDPRGRFGRYDIYGDERYELAKLMHSMDGEYDYIVENMFAIEVDGMQIALEMPGKTGDVYKIFCDVFADRINQTAALKLIESTLFLSMIPLHSDYPNRQFAMLARGLQLWEEGKKLL